mmetsp:Transcript_28816/g.67066  ORF Transcript_28816/g.67066 Transcript_28816/m.67066 type:complete len:335 (+) Transcript_28816:499-1503(+)
MSTSEFVASLLSIGMDIDRCSPKQGTGISAPAVALSLCVRLGPPLWSSAASARKLSMAAEATRLTGEPPPPSCFWLASWRMESGSTATLLRLVSSSAVEGTSMLMSSAPASPETCRAPKEGQTWPPKDDVDAPPVAAAAQPLFCVTWLLSSMRANFSSSYLLAAAASCGTATCSCPMTSCTSLARLACSSTLGFICWTVSRRLMTAASTTSRSLAQEPSPRPPLLAAWGGGGPRLSAKSSSSCFCCACCFWTNLLMLACRSCNAASTAPHRSSKELDMPVVVFTTFSSCSLMKVSSTLFFLVWSCSCPSRETSKNLKRLSCSSLNASSWPRKPL